LLAGVCRTGMTKSSYFQHFDSVYAKEQYVDPHKIERDYEKKIHQRASFHERDFLPSSPSAILYDAFYSGQSLRFNIKVLHNPSKEACNLMTEGRCELNYPTL
jgi:hypothetical protein